MYNKTHFFRSFLDQVARDETLSESIHQAENRYHIRAYTIGQITPQKALEIYECINSKFYKKNNHMKSTTWFQNQLRLFVWVVISYCHLNMIKVQELGEQAWAFFSLIFDRKDSNLFQYQCHCLYLQNKANHWQQQQEELLKRIILSYNASNTKVKWNEISKQLFQASNKLFLRTPKQCRERWNNHLDPSKVKGMWKREQYIKMFEYVRDHGKKWASLVKVLNNTRNEHSIKNKFNSMIKRHIKSNKEKGTHPMSDFQLYTSIINKVESAITNQKNHNNKNEDQINFQQEQTMRSTKKQQIQQLVEPKKAQNFAEKLMYKLMNFGDTGKKNQVNKLENSQFILIPKPIKETKTLQSISLTQKREQIAQSSEPYSEDGSDSQSEGQQMYDQDQQFENSGNIQSGSRQGSEQLKTELKLIEKFTPKEIMMPQFTINPNSKFSQPLKSNSVSLYAEKIQKHFISTWSSEKK